MEQTELNQKLYNACRCEKIDLDCIEKLLQLGADPLGSANESDPEEHILGELFCEASDNPCISDKMPNIVQLFYDYGMNIESKKIPDDGDNINPLWMLAFNSDENGLKTLKVMLENGLDCDSAEILVDHILTDMEMCGGSGIDDEWFLGYTICSLKMIMLIASYSRMIEKSEYIRQCIEIEKNNSLNLCRFRSWNDFDYHIDLSTCINAPHGLQNATITIKDKITKKNTWTFFA